MENLIKNITALKPGNNPKSPRSSVYLNGKFAFSLDNEVIVRERLKVGKGLSSDEIKKLNAADRVQLCLNSAYKFLSYRPRSEAEISERLKRKGYTDREIEDTVVKLKKMQLLNDATFAEFWKENRNTLKPRSKKVVSLELRQKGVETEIIKQVVSDIDDTENAYRTAAVRARNLAVSDYKTFRQKLGSYLARRGFSYGVINTSVQRIWQEKTQKKADESESFEPELQD